MTAAADRHLLFGLLALQNGLIDQGQLVAAFQAWSRDKSKSLAENLETRGDKVWAKIPAPDIENRFERARALTLLAGLGKDAKSGVTTAESAAFAEQSVAALRDAIKAGWNTPGELKMPDFDAVRDRADFKQLMADLDVKAPTPREKK